MEDGLIYLNEDMVKTLETSSKYKDEVRQSRFEKKRRAVLYRLDLQYKLSQRIVVFVDDGSR